MPVIKKPAPRCHCCNATAGQLKKAGHSSRWYTYETVQKVGCLHTHFHPAALPRLRGAGQLLGPSADDPSRNRICSHCFRHWQQYMADGGRAGLDQRLRATVMAARKAAGMDPHPMAHGDMRVLYWSPGERVSAYLLLLRNPGHQTNRRCMTFGAHHLPVWCQRTCACLQLYEWHAHRARMHELAD